MIRGGGGGLLFCEKNCLAKSDEKIVCSANCKKIKRLFTNLAEKWGYMGKKFARSFA